MTSKLFIAPESRVVASAARQSNMLDLGLQLGRMYQHANDRPSAKTRAAIEATVRSLLPAGSDATIKSKFSSASKLTDGYRWAMRIYTLVDQKIKFRI